ncbi:MAG: hypothetical protein VXZ47_02390 [Candidatus Thermoplasmatota archaeon]|nr:hypothetical protein [Candidatus Thermoplasmatota archaeon]
MKPIDSDIEIIKIAMKIDFAALEPRFLLYTGLCVNFMFFGNNTPFISFSSAYFSQSVRTTTTIMAIANVTGPFLHHELIPRLFLILG